MPLPHLPFYTSWTSTFSWTLPSQFHIISFCPSTSVTWDTVLRLDLTSASHVELLPVYLLTETHPLLKKNRHNWDGKDKETDKWNSSVGISISWIVECHLKCSFVFYVIIRDSGYHEYQAWFYLILKNYLFERKREHVYVCASERGGTDGEGAWHMGRHLRTLRAWP